MKKFNWTNIKLVLMFALVIFLYSFTSKRNEQRKLKKSVVEFVNENSPFITQEAVNKLLIENNAAPTSIQKDELDLNKLEKNLNNHNMIEKCDVFVSVDGVLKAVVKQKTPVARVFDETVLFILIMKDMRCRYLIISLPEFQWLRGGLAVKIKKN